MSNCPDRPSEALGSEERNQRYELLYRVSDAMISTLEPRGVLELILEQAVHILGATNGSLIMLNESDPNLLNIEVAYNLDPEKVQRTRLRLGEGVTGRVAQSGQALVLPDVKKDENYVEIEPEIRSEIAAPLKLGNKVIGVLNLDSKEAGAFTANDLEFFVSLANHASKVIQNAKLYDSVRQKAEALRLLQSINRSISSSLDLNEVLKRIVRGAVQLLGAKLGSVLLLDETGQSLQRVMSHGKVKKYRPHPNLPVEGSMLGSVILEKRAMAVQDVQVEPLFIQKAEAKEEGLHALIAVPMMVAEKAIGVLTVYFDQIRKPDENEVEQLTALADQSATAMENARLHERVFRMEEQIRQQDKMTAVGETASGLAHEIRNPLAVINMLVSALDEDFEEEDPRREDLRVIQKNITHIHGLVEEMLNFARYRVSEPSPTNLCEVVEGALALMGPKFSRLNIRIKKDFEDEVPLARVDAGRMQQVLLNLLQNAIDAIGTRGEISLALRCSTSQDIEMAGAKENVDYLTLTVQDTGAGIAAEAYQRLFEPFNTTKEQGVGLGLSIVKRIVEEHGGRLAVKSSATDGTRFNILLPVASDVEKGSA